MCSMVVASELAITRIVCFIFSGINMQAPLSLQYSTMAGTQLKITTSFVTNDCQGTFLMTTPLPLDLFTSNCSKLLSPCEENNDRLHFLVFSDKNF